jgi:hypothetical protein
VYAKLRARIAPLGTTSRPKSTPPPAEEAPPLRMIG